jgi:cell division protein FtsB
MAKRARTVKNIQPSTRLRLAAFKKEITKLQEQNAKLEAENFRLNARVKVLEKERKLSEPPSPKDMVAIARRIAFVLRLGGLDIHGNPVAKK